MDAAEQLLVSEGVCRQLGIVNNHPEVQSGYTSTQESADDTVTETSGDPVKVSECRIPTINVRLVRDIRIPSNSMAIAEVQIEGLSPSK